VRISDKNIELTPSEFKILEILMTSPGRVYSRLQLMEMLQGPALDGVLRTIDVHVRNLRSKIEPDSSSPIYIETVFGVGYRFRAEAS
jgi:DNA-binding response OmpR family regulator